MNRTVIFRYNKEGNLTDFVNKNNEQINQLICLKNNFYLKYLRENLTDPVSVYKEYTKFSENIKLHTTYMVGEYWIRAIQENGKEKNFGKKQLFLASSNSDIINFSINHNIISDWVKKLKGN